MITLYSGSFDEGAVCSRIYEDNTRVLLVRLDSFSTNDKGNWTTVIRDGKGRFVKGGHFYWQNFGNWSELFQMTDCLLNIIEVPKEHLSLVDQVEKVIAEI